MELKEEEEILKKIDLIYNLKKEILAPEFFDAILALVIETKNKLFKICDDINYPYLDVDSLFLIELEKNMNIYKMDESPEVKALCKNKIYFLIELNLNFWAF